MHTWENRYIEKFNTALITFYILPCFFPFHICCFHSFTHTQHECVPYICAFLCSSNFQLSIFTFFSLSFDNDVDTVFFLFIAADCENAIEEERERVVVFNEISHRTPIHNDCTTRTEILDLGVSLERVIQKTVQINNLIKTTWSIQWCIHTEFGRSAQCQVCECSTERKTRKLVCFKCANCVIDCFQTS